MSSSLLMVQTPRLPEVVKAWTPPSIRVLLAVTLALGSISVALHWPDAPFNAAAMVTVLAANAKHQQRVRRAEEQAHEQQLAMVYAHAVADVADVVKRRRQGR